MNKQSLILTAALFFHILSVSAQLKETTLLEESVDPSIVMKHYINEPNDKATSWAQFEENEQTFYKVYLIEDNLEKAIIYSADGLQLEKWEIISEVPKIITNYLTFEFGKYKIKNYRRVEEIGKDSAYFAIDVNSRHRGYRRVKFYPSGEPYLNGITQTVVSN